MLISRWALTNKVDPFIAPIPQPWIDDPEVGPFAEYLNRFLHDLWVRTGGGNDAISDSGVKELYPWATFTPTRFLEDIEIAAGDTAFTTTIDQFIVCNNTAAATITLNTEPEDGEELVIARRNAGVIMAGVVNGKTNPSLALKLDTAHLKFSVAAGEWVVI
jgi:hypothetical protein